MDQVSPPATAPALMEQLIQLRSQFEALADEARRHWAAEERRFTLIDQFIDPQLSLESLLKQLFDALERNRRAVQDLEREHRRLAHVIELALATHTRERPQTNGQRIADTTPPATPAPLPSSPTPPQQPSHAPTSDQESAEAEQLGDWQKAMRLASQKGCARSEQKN
jgi:hypothetical protein